MEKIEINLVKDKIIITSPYRKSLILFMQTERGYPYHPESKTRQLPFTKTGIKKLAKFLRFLHTEYDEAPYELLLDETMQRVLNELREHQEEQSEQLQQIKDKEQALISDTLSRLRLTLFPYQKEGLDFISKTGGLCILGDEMGLGKTAQAIAWTFLLGRKSLVVCPKSLIYNWLSEIEKFSGLKGQVWKSEIAVEGEAQWYLINYDQLHGRLEELKKLSFDTLILDEAHAIKNPKAKRTKAVLKLAKKVKYKIFLSGTSIKNRPIEFWTQLHLLAPGLFDNWFAYAKRYCGARKTPFGYDVGRATHLAELHEKIKDFYIRRNKIDVFKDMPPKLISKISVEGKIAWLKKNSSLEIIADAKMRLALAKIPETIALAKTMMDMDEKIVIFSDYVRPCEEILEALTKDYGEENCFRLCQEDDAFLRMEKVNLFQKKEGVAALICTMKLGGVGLNLTSASHMIFNDLPWSPGDLLQAEDRIYRIGQEKTCNIYRIVMDGTEIEKVILAQLHHKEKNISMVLKGHSKIEEEVQTPIESLQQKLRRQFDLLQ